MCGKNRWNVGTVDTAQRAEPKKLVLFQASLRRRNTRYKNPQLVAQHCFVANFGRCFAFFTLHDQKHLLQVEEMQRYDWLIWQSASKFVAHHVVSWMENEQQSQSLLHKVDPRTTFRNNFLQPATNVFVARQVDYERSDKTAVS